MMINSIVIITTGIVTPTVMPVDEELLNEELVGGLGDGVGCSVTITQSSELNESSIVGQLGSTLESWRQLLLMVKILVISLTTSSAEISEAEACTATLALNTTAFSKFSCAL